MLYGGGVTYAFDWSDAKYRFVPDTWAGVAFGGRSAPARIDCMADVPDAAFVSCTGADSGSNLPVERPPGGRADCAHHDHKRRLCAGRADDDDRHAGRLVQCD